VDRAEPSPLTPERRVTRWWGTVDRAEPSLLHTKESDKVRWGTVDRGGAHVPSYALRKRQGGGARWWGRPDPSYILRGRK
jgi:hypothetical protein